MATLYAPIPPAWSFARGAPSGKLFAAAYRVASFVLSGSPAPSSVIATADALTLTIRGVDGPLVSGTVMFSFDLPARGVTEFAFGWADGFAILGSGYSCTASRVGSTLTLVLSRVPGWFGTPQVTVVVTDAGGGQQWASLPFWTVSPAVSLAPVVSGVTPATGTTIATTATLQCDVTSGASPLRAAILIVKFADGRWECVHDGTNFAPGYASSTRTGIANGYRFVLRRGLGWPPGGITGLEPIAINQLGREN